jgi:hypothetical protein
LYVNDDDEIIFKNKKKDDGDWNSATIKLENQILKIFAVNFSYDK